MKIRRLGFSIALVSSTLTLTSAADDRISALLRSMMDGGSLPSEKAFDDAFDEEYVRNLPGDRVQEFLKLARTLLHDPRPEARRYALTCVWTVKLRFSDGDALLDPYVEDLLRIVDDRPDPLRLMALDALDTWPNASSKTLTYFAAHLADKDNSESEAGGMAGTLLRAGSDLSTRRVIAVARQKKNQEFTESVLQCLRLFPTNNPDALSFVGDSLDSPDEGTRRKAVEAVAALPMVQRSPFLEQLARLSTDPKQPEAIRSEAAEALKK